MKEMKKSSEFPHRMTQGSLVLIQFIGFKTKVCDKKMATN